MENAMNHSESFKVVNALYNDCCRVTISESDLILNLVKEVSEKSRTNIMSFIEKDCVEYSKKKLEIYQKHDIDNTLRFNIFESISDKYYWEDFHSDILFTILNPNTREIGNPYFVEEFVKFLGVDFDCTKDIEVTREEPTDKISWTDDSGKQKKKDGYIDLLIKNDKQAIIIENKIYYAPDQENQLVRYMKYVEETLGLEIIAVVYLTLIDDKKPLLKYDEYFEKYTKLLTDKSKGILKKVYAVNNDEKKGLAKGFLEPCLKRLGREQPQDDKVKNGCNIAAVYINQYKMLLEHLGGKGYMKSTDKKLIEKIYSSKDKFDAANDFVEFWNDKKQRNAALDEALKEKLKKVFKEKPWEEEDGVCYCLSESLDNVFVFYCIDSNNKDDPRQIGFYVQGEKRQNELNKLEKIFNKIQNRGPIKKEELEWIWCNINDTVDLFKDIIEGLKVLFAAKPE